MGLAISVDVGLGECAKLVGEILGRRAKREENHWLDLCDDLDATFEIVKTLNDLFFAIVTGYYNEDILDDPERLKDLVNATRAYLDRMDLVPYLKRFIGNIKAVSTNERKKHPDLSRALAELAEQLVQFRGMLSEQGRTGIEHEELAVLMTLTERVLKMNYGGGKLEIGISKLADHTHKNYDHSFTEGIYELIGEAQQQAKQAMR